jgi:carboxypeptidase C (cathepsin A)
LATRFEPIVQNIAYYNFTVSPGNTYDYRPFNESYSQLMYNNLYQQGGCIDGLKDCAVTGDNEICANADDYCTTNVDNLWEITTRDETEIRELNDDPFPYGFYVDYLNRPEVQQAIGAYTNFSTESQTVSDAFDSTGDDAREANTIEYVQSFLARGGTVNLYFGDADYSVNWYGGEAVAKLIGVDGWDEAGYVNVTTSDEIVHGQVKQAGKFSFMRVYYAGHEAPFYKPVLLLETLERILGGKDVATGQVEPDEWYRTKGPAESTFREGNSTIQWKQVYTNTTYDVDTNAPGAPWPSAHPDLETDDYC